VAAEIITTIRTEYSPNTQLWEWTIDDTIAQPTWRVCGPFTDITVQWLTLLSGAPTIGIEGSLNRPDDGSIIAFRLTDPTQTLIALAAVGGKAVLESPYIIRPRVVAGAGQAVVRIKASKVFPGM
jgi:hypothetical protein